jgi:hypothetical protein
MSTGPYGSYWQGRREARDKVAIGLRKIFEGTSISTVNVVVIEAIEL